MVGARVESHRCRCRHGDGHRAKACVQAQGMGWLRLVGSFKFQVSFAKEPHKRDDILQKRPIFLRSLLIVDTPYELM